MWQTEIVINPDCLQRVAQGDEEAFAFLIETCSPAVFRFLRRMLNSVEEAEDLAQDTFCDVFKHRAKLKTDCDVMPYLFTIARRKAISHLRWRKVRWVVGALQPVHDNTIPAQTMNPEEAALANDVEQAIHQELSRLKPEKRDVMILRFFENLSYKEISEIVRRPETTVRSIAFRAERELRERLETYQDAW